MLLNRKIAESITAQINKELFSAYLYLDFANYFDDEGLKGFASWYTIQAKEEQEHAQKFIDFMKDNNERVQLLAIDAPKPEYSDYGEMLEQALAHEEYITASIHKIYDLAVEVKDYRTQSFLNWFVDEQLEEEKNANDLIAEYNLIKGTGGILTLDQKLGQREA